MEYLEGETLASRLAQGRLPLAQALRTGIEIADALDKAHRQGVIHRDLKPGNIMLTRSGAKLLDFGLAKFHQPAGAPGLSAAPTITSPLTGAGNIVGTFQYMPPEQLEGREADARSDIFAFGAVLYEMVTGKRAFTGATQAASSPRSSRTRHRNRRRCSRSRRRFSMAPSGRVWPSLLTIGGSRRETSVVN